MAYASYFYSTADHPQKNEACLSLRPNTDNRKVPINELKKFIQNLISPKILTYLLPSRFFEFIPPLSVKKYWKGSSLNFCAINRFIRLGRKRSKVRLLLLVFRYSKKTFLRLFCNKTVLAQV